MHFAGYGYSPILLYPLPPLSSKRQDIKMYVFWWMPKFFKAKSGPLSLLEKAVSLMTCLIIIMLPMYWLLQQPGLLIIYILSVGVLGATLRRYECNRCVYFQCPSNCVPEELK